ncbi:MAG: PKD domain-containing protein, partial [Bdellovibrionales bacterium]
MILTILLAVFVTACGNSSNSSSESSSLNAAESVSKVVLRTDGITFTAPQYVMVSMTGHYALNVPTGVSITSANWTFSDGTTATGAAPIDHQFFNLGLNTVTVNVVDSLGTTMIFTQPLTVVPYNELLYCLSDLAITVPQDADIGATIQMGVTIPPCLTAINATVQWNYG